MPLNPELSDYEPLTKPGSDKTRNVGRDADSDTEGGFNLRAAESELGSSEDSRDDWVKKNSASSPGIAASEQPGSRERSVNGGVAGKNAAAQEVSWLARRGHALSFAGLFLFTCLLYFRPYEVFPSLTFLSSAAFWVGIVTLAVFVPTQLSLEGNLTARPREVNLVLLLTLLALISVLIAIDRTEAWDMFSGTFIKVVLIFIVTINVVRTEFRLKALLLLSLAVSIVLSFNAIRDYLQGQLSVEGYRVRPSIGGMFGNPNDMAIHLVTVIPLAIVMGFASRSALKKIIYFLCAAMFVGGTIVSYSRGAFLALVAVSLVLVWKLSKGSRLGGLVLLVFAVLALAIFAPGNYLGRILSIVGLAEDPLGSASARQTLLFHSIKVALRNPFGVGMANYHFMAPHEQVSHNAYTQVSAELGIIGLVAYVMLMITAFKRLLLIERTSAPEVPRSRFNYLAIGLQAALIGYMVSSFFASVAYQWYVYYLVGFSFCLHHLYQSSGLVRSAKAATPVHDEEMRARELART